MAYFFYKLDKVQPEGRFMTQCSVRQINGDLTVFSMGSQLLQSL